ncbi:hypothetical protein NP493_2g18054 [Ridgeia piscesae]|uniref:UDP-glucose 4-epimerase n=1 Tax=Ridgeia piscesae TaxID=27915 RepID=A0AAD9ULZ0_RIDPI|nr:hypothetical protein NP493_2g18054 [Ridgeia piscesae]
MSEAECVLITGGAGYIGSHTTIEVINSGYTAVIIDNLCNSSIECIHRVTKILGHKVPFYQCDVRNKKALQQVFSKHKIAHVLHFAGVKAVGESCRKPLMYYKNNMECTFTLLEVMREYEVFNLVFSSSATVYGVPKYLPVDEKHVTGGCTSPYGRTKYYLEQMMYDLAAADERWNFVLLRYFNPAGAHPSGEIGEDPSGPPNNLMPYMAQVAVGRRKELQVFGSDYDTPDGTGVRDYIHVVDLAVGHVNALKKLSSKCGIVAYNLGTGQGYSVLDMIHAFEKASGKEIPYQMAPRRTGDVDSCYADATIAQKELGWKAKYGLTEMCEDLWRWQSMNPHGFNPPQENGDCLPNGHAK